MAKSIRLVRKVYTQCYNKLQLFNLANDFNGLFNGYVVMFIFSCTLFKL